ncbi:lysophospholipid acyltransferase family protein [Stappia indica]|uniref:lysophospholipid acyltransferase family protein n=1 Tax=Stappia indica TaxID=538381 RepID=UPI001CD5D1CF|nr:lysophospholipid acyltransferase family protein [Stappia indica]MCA1298621.1 1-acyl-sn-glycerol-3-phosphate acyltransferase [Stappia indica]
MTPAGPDRAPASRFRPLRAGPLVVLRSLAFLLLVLASLVLMSVLTPLLIMPRRACLAIVRQVLRFWLWLLKVIAGLDYEVRGRENLPIGGCLVASKHQSAFETLALQVILDDPAIVLKRELTLIPLAGWTMWRLGHISINRTAGASALMNMVRDARARLAEGRQVVIFPEGTRSAPLAPPSYKSGLSALYRSLRVPCVPIALNSGVFWPRRSLWRFPGRIVIDILPPIPPGLDQEAFRARLQETIEDRTRILVEAAETGR